jgi:hypothetical protein
MGSAENPVQKRDIPEGKDFDAGDEILSPHCPISQHYDRYKNYNFLPFLHYIIGILFALFFIEYSRRKS